MRYMRALICLGLAAMPLKATDYTWNGTVDTVYGTAGNWTPGATPGAGDNIFLTTAQTILLNSNRSINIVTISDAGAVFSHTSLQYTVSGTIAVSAGTYSLNGGKISGGAFTTSGSGKLLIGTNSGNELISVQLGPILLDMSTSGAQLTLTGTTNFTSATSFTTGQNSNLRLWTTGLVGNAAITLGNGAVVSMVNAGGNHMQLAASTSIYANGTTTGTTNSIAGNVSYLTISNFGRIENLGLGLLSVSAGTLNNYGTIINSGSGKTSFGTTSFTTNNAASGLIDAAAGTVVLYEMDSNAGTVRVRPGATLQYDGTFSAPAAFGTVDRGVSGTDGTVQNIGTMNVTASFVLPTGTMEQSLGTINGNGFAVTGGATAKIRPMNNGSTYNIADNVLFGANTLDLSVASGRFQMQGGTNFTATNATTMGPGFFLRIAQGQAIDNLNLTVSAETLNTSVLASTAAGMHFSSSSNITVVTTASGSGGVTIGYVTTASPITFDGVVDNQRSSSSVAVFGSPLTINGTLRNSGAGQTIVNNSGGSYSGTVGPNGIIEATAGTMTMGAAANLSNYSAGTLTGGTYRAINNATFTFSPGSITALGANTTVEIGGTATFTAINNLASNTGTFLVTGGKSFTVAGTPFNNTGTIQILGSGTFSIPNAISLANFASNTLSNGTWVVGGTMDMGTRTIQTLAASTTVEFNGTTPVFAALTANLATNNGTLRNIAGSPALMQTLTNGGLLDIAGGSLTIQGNLINNSLANLTVAAGATLLVQGQFTNNGNYTVAGSMTTGNAGFLNGGTLLNTGTIGFGTTLDVNQATTIGSGTVNVTGQTTLNANLTVNPGVTFGGAGAVLVTSTRKLILNGTANKPVTVQANGAVEGSGIIGGALSVAASGRVRPGNSPGLLTILDNIDLRGIYDFDILNPFDRNGGTAGTGGDFDRIDIPGGPGTAVVVHGSASIRIRTQTLDQSGGVLLNSPGSFWLSTRTWDIIKGNADTQFTLEPGVTATLFDANDAPYDYANFGTFAFGIDNAAHSVAMTWQPVPEPAILLPLCGILLAGRRLRKSPPQAAAGYQFRRTCNATTVG